MKKWLPVSNTKMNSHFNIYKICIIYTFWDIIPSSKELHVWFQKEKKQQKILLYIFYRFNTFSLVNI